MRRFFALVVIAVGGLWLAVPSAAFAEATLTEVVEAVKADQLQVEGVKKQLTISEKLGLFELNESVKRGVTSESSAVEKSVKSLETAVTKLEAKMAEVGYSSEHPEYVSGGTGGGGGTVGVSSFSSEAKEWFQTYQYTFLAVGLLLGLVNVAILVVLVVRK
ncbi:MAG TPA: hypothetical protein VFW38_01955 [Solirubrobacteraceae bacterium]|nr:hypothetical protein [Solirubrobacteraceae bacterium]